MTNEHDQVPSPVLEEAIAEGRGPEAPATLGRPAGMMDAALRAGGAGAIQRRIQRRAIQRRAQTGGEHADVTSAGGSGSALPPVVQDKMEHSLGSSFADVRVHEGGQAAALGAQAYTQGSDIHFAPGHYDPHGTAGQELLGHELTHVVQQRAGRVSVPQGKGAPINEDSSLEAEADALGARAARGEQALAPGQSPGQAHADGAVQRKPFREHTVSPNVMGRLSLATAAIQHVNNKVMTYGAGNQMEDVIATGGLSKERADKQSAKGTRDAGASYNYEIKPNDKTQELMGNRPGSEPGRKAAAAEHWHAGVCDDYANVTFNYLREHAGGEPIARVSVAGGGHAFCIIGDLDDVDKTKLVVADPWPTRPQACTWPDFFQYRDDFSQVQIKERMASDGISGVKKHKKEVKFFGSKVKAKKMVKSLEKAKGLIAGNKASMWNERQTVSEEKTGPGADDVDSRPIFYVQGDWDEPMKARMEELFADDLERNKHLSQSTMRKLGLQQMSDEDLSRIMGEVNGEEGGDEV